MWRKGRKEGGRVKMEKKRRKRGFEEGQVYKIESDGSNEILR